MRARVIALAAAAVAYVLVSHWLMTGAPASPWNAVIVVGPMLGAAAVVAWQRRQRLLAALAALRRGRPRRCRRGAATISPPARSTSASTSRSTSCSRSSSA